jgi:hypothetical protein
MDILIFFITLTAQVLTTIAIVMSIARSEESGRPAGNVHGGNTAC